jgi:hypothetical protein
MVAMLRTLTIYTPFIGFDATITVEYEITHWGAPAVIDHVYGGEPAEGPEWEVGKIGVVLDLGDSVGAEWRPDWRTAAWRVLANSRRIEQAIIDDIASIDRPRSRRRYWEDA